MNKAMHSFRRVASLSAAMLAVTAFAQHAAVAATQGPNVAVVAKATTSFVSGHELLSAIQDGITPRDSLDHDAGAYGNWPQRGTQWVQYEWDRPVTVNGVGVYWWDDHQGVRLPKAARLSYWDGSSFKPVPNAAIGVASNKFNTADFAEIKTTKLKLEFDSGEGSTGIIEFQAYDSGNSPAFAPTADAGVDRTVVIPAATVLHGGGRGIQRPGDQFTGKWSKVSGPGDVTFANATYANTTATFSAPGDYTIKYTTELRGLSGDDTIEVKVQPAVSVDKLHAVYASSYKVSSPFWRDRLKNLIINWIPHCVDMCDKPDLREGGINNMIEAGKALRGEPAKRHVGYPFANAWVLNTAESMAVALTFDAEGDPQILAAQAAFRKKLDQWIPIILAAQEPDGYFQTRFTLGTRQERRDSFKAPHWDPRFRAEHEGYVAGYFIEMGIAHCIATHGQDRRLYDAARKLADCWVNNIGPAPKKAWYDGHQEMEQALVRLGRFVNDTEGAGTGQKYIDLAKFLLDSRSVGNETDAQASTPGDFYTGHGGEYDQSHVPVTQQYEAVGHAVRAAYTYSAMADITAETGNADYWSATLSLWDNIVNKKYYVTGGIGSGETSEGFGKNYSLPNGSAYVESCSSCGLLYMQYKLNLATRNAKFADLYETTIYNAILGDVDLQAQNFTYTNSLDSQEKRYKWHVCPCCVGNIPRVLLMLPTWMYTKDDKSVYVNLFAGSTVNVGKIAGADVELMQTTEYPWKGQVAVTVNPSQPAKFTVNVRSPKRDVSELYKLTPAGDGITTLKVNGQSMAVTPDASGYIAIDREWKAGDKIEFDLPLPVQTITASDKIAATRGRVAVARGPLIYNIESVDGDVNKPVGQTPSLAAQWSPELLGGVMSLHGTYADGSPLLAIPNYARLNRGGRSLVWMKQ
ncbi:MAG: glycoside hydrolase family 127 protein [Tepidisphaeraceae bacterium]